MITTHPSAIARVREAGRELRRTRLLPPPKLSVSEWADRYRMLARGTSPESGQWRTERAPYLREIMDAVSDPLVEQVVVMKPRRVGGTEAMNNVIGYFMDQDPSPMLMVQPTVELAEGWSKEHLAPMIAATPALRELVQDPRARDSGNTVLQKTFSGGRITVLGANSGTGFRMRGARVVLCDEVDAWPDSAGSEGDPVELAIGRADQFWNRKIVLTSTPLLKGLSRIEQAYGESDGRQRWWPCLECGHFQVPSWRTHIKIEGLDAPHFQCEACEALLPEECKFEMERAAEWRPLRPEITSVRGYQFQALISLFDGARWDRLAEKWGQTQQDPTRLQVFVNQFLAETWEDRGGALSTQVLAARREAYAAPVPAGVGLLTAGVDVQADRLVVTVRGWGASEETWHVESTMLVGDTSGPVVWQLLDEYLLREWAHERGGAMKVHTACVDSGYSAEMVHRFCRARFGRRVFATRGYSAPGRPLVNRRPSRNNKVRCPVFYVGTDTAKDLLFGRLRVQQPGPGHWHFGLAADGEYFEQLTSEKRVRKQVAGRWVSRYELLPDRENHYLDTEVGNVVALALSGVPLASLQRRAEAQGGSPASVPAAPAPDAEPLPEAAFAPAAPPAPSDAPPSRTPARKFGRLSPFQRRR